MADKTGIEWTRGDDGTPGATWNPTSGCDRVSPGCDRCYALTLAKRLKGMGSPHYQRDGDPVTSGPGFGLTTHDDALTLPLRWRKPRRVFVNSMSDLFHDAVPDDFIARVWQVMGAAPQHTYQVLTKRHARLRSWVTRWCAGEIPEPYDVRAVPGYPGYRVTTLGQVLGVRSDTAEGLKVEAGEQGHGRVTMHRAGSPPSGERELVHRLVLSAFVRPPIVGEQARHRNGDPTDNRLSNLAWGTQADNWRDRDAHGARQSYTKLTEKDVEAIRRRAAAGEVAYSIAKDYPVSDTQIRNVLAGRHWSTPLSERPAGFPRRAVLESVWLGVSVEDQKWADIRIPALLDTPAAVRFLSVEPMLGPVDLEGFLPKQSTLAQAITSSVAIECRHGYDACPMCDREVTVEDGVSWVICGGESGPGARPMHPDWARSLRDQCVAAGVPYFFKQHGEWAPANRAFATHLIQRNGSFITRPDSLMDNPYGQGSGLGQDFVDRGHGGWARIRRVGKKAAGRELDGRTWDEYPSPAPVSV